MMNQLQPEDLARPPLGVEQTFVVADSVTGDDGDFSDEPQDYNHMK
jgi:hypothetical protein